MTGVLQIARLERGLHLHALIAQRARGEQLVAQHRLAGQGQNWMSFLQNLQQQQSGNRCDKRDIGRQRGAGELLGLVLVQRPRRAGLLSLGQEVLADEAFLEIDLLADKPNRMRPPLRVAERRIKRESCRHRGYMTVFHNPTSKPTEYYSAYCTV